MYHARFWGLMGAAEQPAEDIFVEIQALIKDLPYNPRQIL